MFISNQGTPNLLGAWSFDDGPNSTIIADVSGNGYAENKSTCFLVLHKLTGTNLFFSSLLSFKSHDAKIFGSSQIRPFFVEELPPISLPDPNSAWIPQTCAGIS